MAKKEIVVKYGEEETSFSFVLVNRAKLYGRKERVILDENGERCVPAYLTPDGAALVPPGGTAHVYVDEAFDTVDRKDLRAVDDDGNELEPIESTLGVVQELTPARPERLLDHIVKSVYELDSETLGESLKKALADGEIFETVYQNRLGYDPDAFFLMQNEEGVFGLVAKPSGFDFTEREAPTHDLSDEDEDDDISDDFDFSMM